MSLKSKDVSETSLQSIVATQPRVVLVTHYFPNHLGGIEIFAGRLAYALVALYGYRIDWFASDCDAPPSGETNGLEFCPMRSWNGIEASLKLPWPVWSLPSLRRLARAVERSDVVHIHDFIYLGSIFAVVLAYRYGKSVLITQHIGLIPFKSRTLTGVLRLINTTLGRLMLGRATRIVFISEAVMMYFSGFIRWKSSPSLLPNGIDTTVFRAISPSERDVIRRQYGFRGDRPIFLFVGRFVEKKGLLLLQRFATALPMVDWVFAGHGDARPEAWNLTNVFVFRGLSGESLVPLYQISDLLVLPSRGEGFPLVVQEAMACGTSAFISTETLAGAPYAAAMLFHENCETDADVARWVRRLGELASAVDELSARRAGNVTFASANWGMTACAEKYHALLSGLGRPSTRFRQSSI